MQIDLKALLDLEEMSNLSLSDDEKLVYVNDLQKVLDSLKHLGELNTANIPECIQPFENVNVFRNDEVLPSLNREQILFNAPKKNNEFFIAPKTVD